MFLSYIFFSNLNQRAINEQTLVGNIGGYLGLFMGYSILQLPSMIHMLARKIRNWYLRMTSKDDSLFRIDIREYSSNLSNDPELGKTNMETNEPNAKLTLEEKIEALAIRVLKMEGKIENIDKL